MNVHILVFLVCSSYDCVYDIVLLIQQMKVIREDYQVFYFIYSFINPQKKKRCVPLSSKFCFLQASVLKDEGPCNQVVKRHKVEMVMSVR